MDKYMDSKNNSSNDRKKKPAKKKTTQKKPTTKKRVGLTEKQKKLPKKIQDAILKKQQSK